MKTLIAFVALVLTGSALACSCGQWGNAKEMAQGSAAAFVGFPNTSSISVIDGGLTIQKTSFVILSNYKSVRYRRTVNVYTEFNTGANCGANFTAFNGVFLIFAENANGKLVANECGLSNVNDKRAIKALNELTM